MSEGTNLNGWGLPEIAARAEEIEQKDLYVLTLPRE